MVTLRDGYHDVMSHKKDFQRFAFDKIENVQNYSFQKLKGILEHAFETSPYYHDLSKQIGFSPRALRSFEDIQALPFLTKDKIEKNKKRMISKRFNRADLEVSYTGGTSGTPTSFYRDYGCTGARIGRQWGILDLCGYSLGDRCGLIWGVHEDLPDSTKKARLKTAFRKFASGKETLCCTTMNSEKMTEFHGRLARFKPSVLYGYPNAMAQFAAFINESKLPPIRAKTIICTAERLTEEQRALLSSTFGGEVFDLYCTREHGCIGFECKTHRGFHIDIGSVHVEIISNGNPVALGETGEIVVTDLLKYGMPFIRYGIGDRGRLSTERCDCGCHLPLLRKLDGRVTDILYRPDGSLVSGVMLVDMFLDEPVVKQVQIVQETRNEVDMYLVVTDDYNQETQRKAIAKMRQFMGDGMNISVKITPEIPPNPSSGKIQEVICKVKPP